MIKKIFFIVSIVLLSISVQAKETMTYKLSYLYIIPFGTAKLTIDQPSADKKDYSLIITPSKIVDFFSKLKASISAHKTSHQTTYHEDIFTKLARPEHNTVVYDHQQNLMTFTRGQFKGLKKKVNPKTLDPFSLLSILRNPALRQKENIQLVLNTHQSNYVFKGQVKNKSEQEWAIKLKMHREDKQDRKPKLKLDVHFKKSLDGKSAIPTLMKAKTLIGPLTLKLVENI